MKKQVIVLRTTENPDSCSGGSVTAPYLGLHKRGFSRLRGRCVSSHLPHKRDFPLGQQVTFLCILWSLSLRPVAPLALA